MIDVLHKVGQLLAGAFVERDDHGQRVWNEDRVEAMEQRIDALRVRAEHLEHMERQDASH